MAFADWMRKQTDIRLLRVTIAFNRPCNQDDPLAIEFREAAMDELRRRHI